MEPGVEPPTIKEQSPRVRPRIRFTPKDAKIYGYVENVYFGPDMTTKSTYSLNQPGTAVTHNMYSYSNRNLNSVKGERKRFFVPDDYTKKKYAVRSNGLQFYASIPIYRMSIADAKQVAIKNMGVVFCNKTPIDADPNSIEDHFNSGAQKDDKMALFEMVWIDKLPDVNNTSYNQKMNKTVTHDMFIQHRRTPLADLSQMIYAPMPEDGNRGYLYQKQDRKLSQNLFMNLLRLSIKEGRTSGIIAYMGGAKRKSIRHRKGKHHATRRRRSRKN